MLRNCLIFSLFIAAIHAGGEFSVLNSPKGISFKGDEALASQCVGDVLYASLGNAVASDSNWSGMTINDPFYLANRLITVYVDGVNHIGNSANSKTYTLSGTDVEKSLNALSAQLESTNQPVYDIDFLQYENGVESFKSYFGDVSVTAAKPTKNLNPSLHTADKEFLEEIGYINAVAEVTKPSDILVIRLSFDNIVKAHGEKSQAVVEAKKILSAAISNLLAVTQKAGDSVLFVQLTNKSGHERSKRDVLAANDKNTLNLAETYDENYPVIFNIILWFMVVFGLSLLAICYAIGSMDPGRDSIIYRMTSTRMKKDN